MAIHDSREPHSVFSWRLRPRDGQEVLLGPELFLADYNRADGPGA